MRSDSDRDGTGDGTASGDGAAAPGGDQARLRSYLEKVTRDLRAAKRRVQDLESSAQEPIAIIGMGCRLPGSANSPEDLWRLVQRGGDGIVAFPEDRGWDLERPHALDIGVPGLDLDGSGAEYVREGGFLDDAAGFDCAFFRIGPREALITDPQQRLMLEVCWETLESAGIDPDTLAGSSTGVFAGAMYQDYGRCQQGLPTGMTNGPISGRIAYAFGLEGPTITVDTACSSSLVAAHLAVNALRAGECSLALAGGVAVLCTPSPFVFFSHQRVLASDARCKAFAEAADGIGISEGVGVLMLERLSDARRAGHPILAVIRGSAVNQDGASNGMTAPNGPAQERVIAQALANARLTAREVDAVEGHGTGTALGDPIEAGALLAAYGQDRERPLYLGSVKSNIGHTQAAAGVAGVIKMVMALREGVLPGTMHVDRPSSRIDWEQGAIELLTQSREWKRNGAPRRAAVSSFGISGTNAHLVLEEAPSTAAFEAPGGVPEAPELPAVPLLLSAKSEQALRAQAARLSRRLRERSELASLDVAFTLAGGRAHMERRAAVVGSDRDLLLGGLDALSRGELPDGVIRGDAGAQGKVAFVFSGQGCQWDGMALGLWESAPVFAAQMDACVRALAPHLGFSLEDVLRGRGGVPGLERIDVLQPALFSVMVSLAALWRSFGVVPSAVVGHSQGEIAAAYVAGGISLDDAARLVALRSRVIGRLAGHGVMVAVVASPEVARALMEPFGERVAVSVLNSPSSLALACDRESADEILARCEEEGIRAREVPGTVPTHSAYVEPLRDDLLELLEPISPRTGEIPFYSTVTGGLVDTVELDGGYWYRNVRRPVLFEEATRALIEDSVTAFVEVTPHPLLSMAVEETAQSGVGDSAAIAAIGSLRRRQGGLERFVRSLAEAHANGIRVDWGALFAGSGASRVDLPTYAFERKRFWLSSPPDAGSIDAVGLKRAEHPLLGAVVDDPDGGFTLSGRICAETHPWLAEHAIDGVPVLAPAVCVELALAAAVQVEAQTIEELVVEAPPVLPESGALALRVRVSALDDRGRREMSIHSRVETATREPALWARNCVGALLEAPQPVAEPSLGQWPPSDAAPEAMAELDERLALAGFDHGPAFQCLDAVWRQGEAIATEASLPEEAQGDGGRYALHPALLDAALRAGLETQARQPTLPLVWRGLRVYAGGVSKLRARIEVNGDQSRRLRSFDDAGRPAICVDSIVWRPVDPDALRGAGRQRPLHRIVWLPWAAPGGSVAGSAALLGEVEAPGCEGERFADLDELDEAIRAGATQPELVVADVRAPRDADVPGASDVSASSDASAAPDVPAAPDVAALPDVPAAFHEPAARVLALLRRWLEAGALTGSRLVLLTEGAALVDGGDPDLAAAPIHGLLRSAQAEHPTSFAVIDLDRDLRSPQALPVALAACREEPQLAIRGGEVLMPRLQAVPASERERSHAPAISAEATVLICGEADRLGGVLARHFVCELGARHVLLAHGEGESAAQIADLRATLEQHGAALRAEACDLCDRAQLQQMLDRIHAEHPLGVVVLADWTFDGGVIESLDRARLEASMGPLLAAAWNLHELTSSVALSELILCSAAAGALGAPGQADRAAAAAFLDALAAHRRARGLPALSLLWGMWADSEAGIAAAAGGDRAAAQIGAMLGLAPLRRGEALELLDAARACDEALLAPVALDSAALRERALAGTLAPVLRELAKAPAPRRRESSTLAATLATLPESEREAAVLQLVRSHAAAVLGHDSALEIDPDRAFQDLGFDSLGAIALRNRLGAATGLKLAPTIIFDHPSPAALARLICERAFDAAEQPAKSRAIARDAAGAAAEEPIAIVGMSCRYPGGASTPEMLWQLLAEGRDGISPFPGDRIRGFAAFGAGEERAYSGGFVEDVADFDAAFFGVAPREASAIDPQQRLMLEGAWEALENAGIDPHSLRGSQTGVFVGATSGEYSMLLNLAEPTAAGSALPGISSSVISGRVSYALGLEGPSLSIDTACSSSLVAIHLASQSLRCGECALALAGGVMVIAAPASFGDLAGSGALAPDGRSKAFAEAADGTGFAEGLGVLVLERLSLARARGHDVLAIVRGSAINQDGASNGLAAPNGLAQERVIRQALANAGLAPDDVDAVEAHGTGTALGDPIEAGALIAAYGQGRAAPLWLGSIKSNIGHAASAAGVAGVIKMVMAMREGALPKTLHAERRSSKIDWSSGRLELLTEQVPWPANGRPRRAGVSSFGVSGTNVHLILEDAPPAQGPSRPVEAPLAQDRSRSVEDRSRSVEALRAHDPSRSADVALPQRQARNGSAAELDRDGEAEAPSKGAAPLAGVVPLAISAKTEPALREAAARLRGHLQAHPELDLLSVGRTLVTVKPRFSHRAVALGEDRQELLDALGALAGGAAHSEALRGDARAIRNTAFVFPGYGSQWPEMTLALRTGSQTFAAAMSECEEALAPHLDWSVDDVLRGADGAPGLDRGDICSIVLFATAVSLARLWQACGVQPSMLAGHSQGELAAAHVAGGLSLRDAAMIAALRVTLMLKIEGRGAMASVALSADRLGERLERFDRRIEIAAANGPSASVAAGETAALQELLAECARDGVQAKLIPGATAASHSYQVEELREELLERFASVSPRSGQIPFYSTVTGGLLDTALLDAEYWYRNARETVLLEPVVRAMVGGGAHALIEVSPHPILGASLRETLESTDGAGRLPILHTLRRRQGDVRRFARALAEAHVAGVEVDWSSHFDAAPAETVKLPTYPFQRQRYWPKAIAARAGDVAAAGLSDAAHPLLAVATEMPDGGWLFNGRVSLADHAWLNDCTLLDAAALPAAACVDLALSAASRLGAAGVRELSLEAPVLLGEQGATQLQLVVGPAGESGERSLSIHSRGLPGEAPDPERRRGEWVCHARGSLRGEALDAAASSARANAEWPPPDAEQLDVQSLYDRLLDGGARYGAAMQGVRAAWRRGRELHLEASLPEGSRDGGGATRFQVHPALLDCAALLAVNAALLESQAAIAPCSLQLARTWREVGAWAAGVSAVRLTISAEQDGIGLSATDLDGRPVLEIGALCGAPIETVLPRRAQHRRLFGVHWSAVDPAPAPSTQPRLALLGDEDWPDLDAERHRDLGSLLRAMDAGGRPDAVIAIAPRSQPGEVPDGAAATSRWGLHALQSWIASEAVQDMRLTVLSTRAVALDDSEEPDLVQAPLWGMVRSAQSEHPGRFALVDVDDPLTGSKALPAALLAGGQEPQIAIRGGALLAPRLRRCADVQTVARALDPDRTVLITGGVSGAGAAVARHLAADRGARHLLLVSRRGPGAEGAVELEAELSALGAQARIVACDVADRAQLEDLLAAVAPEHPLGAVIHSAAVLENGVLELQTPERLEQVMRPKVDAAWHLHELTKDLDRCLFLLFSSAAGVVGTAGQVNYAAANSFLDQLAAHRRRRGLHGISLAWGGWAQQSNLIAEIRDADWARLSRLGIGVLSSEQALELFDLACEADQAQIAPVAIQASSLRAQERAGMLPRILDGLLPARGQPTQATESLRERVAGLAAPQREEVALTLVQEQIATVLGFSAAAEIGRDRALQEMGFDSLAVVELRNHIASASGLQVPMLALANQPTPAGIARHLLAQLAAESGASAGESDAALVQAPPTVLAAMLGAACDEGKLEDFQDALAAAAELRETFEAVAALPAPPRPVRLRDGDDAPCMVLLPSLGPLSGPHEYVRLARELRGDWSVLAPPLPGFAAGELLPASLAALVQALAAGLAAAEAGDELVLGGHSSGGWIAHALAAHLCAEGRPPAAVVLIDTYHPRSPVLGRLVPSVLRAAHEAGSNGPATDDARLTAMAAYSRLFATWEPTSLSVPVVAVRASAARALASEGATVLSDEPHVSVDAPGDHFTVMSEHAASTAKAVEESIDLTRADTLPRTQG